MKKKLFSGIQPSGEIHVGNYVGAIKNWVSLLDTYDCIFCIVDYHAITVEYEPSEMQTRILNASAVNIACGLDPARCTIFVQSHVPEHTELAWIFNTVTPMGELQRMTQFKEKSQQHAANINVGLFDYPVLQAADILLYKAVAVPVGEDQVQHIELSREIARKFNVRFPRPGAGGVFPDPQHLLSPTPRIMGLDGKTKMSKSLNNYIGMLDEPDTIRLKLRTAFTVESRLRRSDPGNPDICNIFTLHKSFTPPDVVARIYEDSKSAKLGCVDCKKMLAENMIRELTPIREKARDLMANPDRVRAILAAGAARCKSLAAETMREAKQVMGLA